MSSNKKLISVVSPVYNEEGNLDNFYKELIKVTATLPAYEFEFVMVNDGSKDSSLLVLTKLANSDKRLKVVNFSRNFGHQMAISAGLDYATGSAVIILDSDLQDPPELISALIEKWETGSEVVNAKRRSRNDGMFKDLTAVFFYKFLNSILVNKLPENVGDFRLLDRKAVDVLKMIKEKDRYLRGLSGWIGFKQSEVEYDRAQRTWGETHYPISKMFSLALNAIFSFSEVPTKLAAFFAVLLISTSFLLVIYAIGSELFGKTVPGWTSQILIFSLFGSIQMFVLTIISEFVGRIYKQVQDRPLYVVSDLINFKSKK